MSGDEPKLGRLAGGCPYAIGKPAHVPPKQAVGTRFLGAR